MSLDLDVEVVPDDNLRDFALTIEKGDVLYGWWGRRL